MWIDPRVELMAKELSSKMSRLKTKARLEQRAIKSFTMKGIPEIHLEEEQEEPRTRGINGKEALRKKDDPAKNKEPSSSTRPNVKDLGAELLVKEFSSKVRLKTKIPLEEPPMKLRPEIHLDVPLLKNRNKDDPAKKPSSPRPRPLLKTAAAIPEEEEEKEEKEERSLDLCLQLDDLSYMCISIPNITTALKSLAHADCPVTPFKHRHKLKDGPRPLASHFDILNNRFPYLLPHSHSQPRIPHPGPPYNAGVCCAVIGSILYCVGGDRNDFQGLDEVFDQLSPYHSSLLVDDYDNPSLVCNSLVDQCEKFIADNCLPQPLTAHPLSWDVDTSNPCSSLSWVVDDDIPTSLPLDHIPPNTTMETVPETPKVLDGICHRIWIFDMGNPALGWTVGNSLISPRISPLLVPFKGKLYAFGGNRPSETFAEVYDPLSDTWTELPPAPFGWISYNLMHVVPLDGWNRLWIYSMHRQVECTFNVLTGEWENRRDSINNISLSKTESYVVSALTPEKHMIVYWIKKGLAVYAYDLSSKQIFKGVISGDENHKLPFGTPLGLHHLHGDLFCLIGATYEYYDSYPTIVHIMIVQISVKPEAYAKFTKVRRIRSNSLTAAVLACFAYPLKEDLHINDSFLMSISR